jgi:hypothetical protein
VFFLFSTPQNDFWLCKLEISTGFKVPNARFKSLKSPSRSIPAKQCSMPEIRNDKQIYRLMNSIFCVLFYELFNFTAAERIIAFRCGPCDVTPMPSTSGYVSLLVDVLIEKFHGPLGTASVAMVKVKYIPAISSVRTDFH